MKDLVKKNLDELVVEIFESYLTDTFCEVYYCDGRSQLKNEDGSWSNLIINISDLECSNNLEFDDDGMSNEDSINLIKNELLEIISIKLVPNNCNTLQIHFGDKNSDGEWDEFHTWCEFEL